jgi:hypothetical protein
MSGSKRDKFVHQRNKLTTGATGDGSSKSTAGLTVQYLNSQAPP